MNAANVYGRGIDEILMRTDYTVTPNRTIYYQDDHEGSVTHLTDATGAVIESYRYDAFGKPSVFSSTSQPLNSSAVNNRFLFTGREYVSTFGIYEYRNRAYHPGLGRFMSEDPKGFDAGDYNLFRYVHNDPEDLTDPMGLYGEGTGWSLEQWKRFDQAQKAAAEKLQNAANRIDHALEAGKNSKEFKSLSKDFQKIYGKNTATTDNMSKVSQTAKGMVTALRDDGSKGYIANGMSGKEMMARFKGTDRNTMAVGRTPGHEIYVNVDHRSFGKESALGWAVGHESAHNMGLEHGVLNEVIAYKYGNEQQRNAYKTLPSLAPEEALHNPDNFMDFAR